MSLVKAIEVNGHRMVEIRSGFNSAGRGGCWAEYCCEHCGLTTSSDLAFTESTDCAHWLSINATHNWQPVVHDPRYKGESNEPNIITYYCNQCGGTCWGWEGYQPNWRSACAVDAMQRVLG